MSDEPTGQEPAEVPQQDDSTAEPQPPQRTEPWEEPERARREIERLRKEAARYRTRSRELEPLAQKARELEEAQKSAVERLTAQLQEEQQRRTALVQRTVRAEIRARAADQFADPDDAAAFLVLDSYVSEDGEIDTDQITADLADLLKRKPHLAKTAVPRRPAPDRSQGSSGNRRTRTDPAAEFAAFMGQKLGR